MSLKEEDNARHDETTNQMTSGEEMISMTKQYKQYKWLIHRKLLGCLCKNFKSGRQNVNPLFILKCFCKI